MFTPWIDRRKILKEKFTLYYTYAKEIDADLDRPLRKDIKQKKSGIYPPDNLINPDPCPYPRLFKNQIWIRPIYPNLTGSLGVVKKYGSDIESDSVNCRQKNVFFFFFSFILYIYIYIFLCDAPCHDPA